METAIVFVIWQRQTSWRVNPSVSHVKRICSKRTSGWLNNLETFLYPAPNRAAAANVPTLSTFKKQSLTIIQQPLITCVQEGFSLHLIPNEKKNGSVNSFIPKRHNTQSTDTTPLYRRAIKHPDQDGNITRFTRTLHQMKWHSPWQTHSEYVEIWWTKKKLYIRRPWFSPGFQYAQEQWIHNKAFTNNNFEHWDVQTLQYCVPLFDQNDCCLDPPLRSERQGWLEKVLNHGWNWCHCLELEAVHVPQTVHAQRPELWKLGEDPGEVVRLVARRGVVNDVVPQGAHDLHLQLLNSARVLQPVAFCKHQEKFNSWNRQVFKLSAVNDS